LKNDKLLKNDKRMDEGIDQLPLDDPGRQESEGRSGKRVENG
jgi:hypothetical protein